MGYVSNKKSRSGYIVKNKIKFPESVQDRILQFLNSGIYQNFLPISVKKQKKKKAVLKCEIGFLTQLTEIFEVIISKKSFLDIVQQIIVQIKSCDKYLLNPNNIELNPESIFFEQRTKKVKCVYWPVVNNQSYVKPRDFFKDLISIAKFGGSDSGEWIREYNLFLNSLQPFSINNFENLIIKLQGKKVQTADISPSSSLLNEDYSSSKLLTNEKVSKISYDPLALSSSTKLKANSKQLVYNQIKLEKINNGEVVNVSTAIFRIGKSNSGNNYVINNPAISRKHAEILTKGDNHFVIDCNSTNGVFINGKRIKPAIEYKIKSGDIIRFANEEFRVL